VTRLRNSVFALITILVSTTLTFLFLNLVTNIFALHIFAQDVFPRGWNNNVGLFYRTLSVQAHDGKLDTWTALLGDSYAEGAGDSYLADIGNYTVAHHLRKQTAKNFLIFARSGFGSISAVREFEIARTEFSKSWFLPDLDFPDEIILLFYEGNDLTDNLRYLSLENVKNLPLRDFVIDEITQPSDTRRKVDFYLPLFRPTYMLAKTAAFSLPGAPAPQSDRTSSLPNDRNTVPNSFKFIGDGSTFQTVLVNDRVQSAATDVSKESVDLALDILFYCLDYLTDRFSGIDVTVVYIPSPVTVYQWNDPIQVETDIYPYRNVTTKRTNDESSIYIRSRISAYSDSEGINFIDPTERLQAKSEHQKLHGPRDWNHFNDAGYKFVAMLINNFDDSRIQPADQ
jgi:hypothetical protein